MNWNLPWELFESVQLQTILERLQRNVVDFHCQIRGDSLRVAFSEGSQFAMRTLLMSDTADYYGAIAAQSGWFGRVELGEIVAP